MLVKSLAFPPLPGPSFPWPTLPSTSASLPIHLYRQQPRTVGTFITTWGKGTLTVFPARPWSLIEQLNKTLALAKYSPLNLTHVHPRLFMLKNYQSFTLALVLATCTACNNESADSTPDSAKAPTTAPKGESPSMIATAPGGLTLPDDAEKVAALEEAGFALTKGTNGLVTEIVIATETSIADALPNLEGVPNVTQARFSGPGLTDDGMEALTFLLSLKRLDLSDSAIGDTTIATVGKLLNLEVLTLRRSGVSNDGLANIANLPKLRALDLRNTKVSDPGLVHLAGLTKLVDLQLEKTNVTDKGIESLVGLPLKSINVNYCTSVSDQALATLKDTGTMESIQFDYTKVSDAGMPNLKGFPKLKRLRIRGTDVTGEGLANLTDAQNLERVELRDSSLDDAGLAVLAALPKMSYVDISECRLVSPEGMQKIGEMKNLQVLILWETKADDKLVNAIADLSGIRQLDLKATSITDECIDSLMKLTNLEDLNVAGTQLGDESFRKLGSLPKLKKLNVANTSIGFDVIDELVEGNEDLQVVEFEN